jgi:hypothetical protein
MIKESNKNLFMNSLDNKFSNIQRKLSQKIGSLSILNSSNSNSTINAFNNTKIQVLNQKKIKNKNEKENNEELDHNNTNEKERLKDEHFKNIGEQEIINRINYLYKCKKNSILENYIFIHLQYLLIIKQNYRLALYFTGRYALCGIKFSFLSKYYLYEFRKYIHKNFIHLKNIKIVKDHYIIKYRKENIFLKKLMNYLLLYQMIKKLMIVSCEKIIYFYTFRIELHNSLYLQKYTKSKIYPIIEAAEKIQNSISKLDIIIENYFKEGKNPIESIELSYLITNFYALIYGKLPQNIIKYIAPILNFKEPHYEKLENEFYHFMMSNPLIINLTNKDTFNINYFTNILMETLEYSYEDLKNKDFHEKLFPGGQELVKEHILMMKEFLFFYKNDFSKEKTFLKAKEGYLVSINFTCKSFPSFHDDFFLIVNVMFNED